MTKKVRATLNTTAIAIAVMLTACTDLTTEEQVGTSAEGEKTPVIDTTVLDTNIVDTTILDTTFVEKPDTDTTGTGTDTVVVEKEIKDTIVTEKMLTDIEIDTLFSDLTVLIEETADNGSDYSVIASQDYRRIADTFEPYLKVGSVKANLGYAVAEMMSLNKSEKLKNVADSLDSYFASFDNTVSITGGSTETGGSRSLDSDNQARSNRGDRVRGIASQLFSGRENSNQISRSYERNGINGLATSLLAKTPEVILSRSESPSWPQFLTVKYIQDIIDDEITPKLGNVIKALEYIEEAGDDGSAMIAIDSESYRIDVADVLILDASIRALRSSLNMFTAYEWDVLEPNKKDYSWIDSLIRIEENSLSKDIVKYTLSNDTLIETAEYKSDEKMTSYAYDLLKYNMERDGFCSIRKNNHTTAYNDLKAIPVKLRKAMEIMENDTSSQEDGIIKYSDVSGEMAGLEDDLIFEGFSAEFASNFKSPTTLINFFEDFITSPYRFNENINGIPFDITIDLSQFYLNPIDDLRDLMPLYAFQSKENSIVVSQGSDYTSSSYYNSNYFWAATYYDSVVIDIPADQVVKDSVDSYGNHYVELTDTFNSKKQTSSYEDFIPFYFLSDAGTKIEFYDMLDMMEEGEIPYFDDYTFNGIFPNMSREAWNTQLKSIIDNW